MLPDASVTAAHPGSAGTVRQAVITEAALSQSDTPNSNVSCIAPSPTTGSTLSESTDLALQVSDTRQNSIVFDSAEKSSSGMFACYLPSHHGILSLDGPKTARAWGRLGGARSGAEQFSCKRPELRNAENNRDSGPESSSVHFTETRLAYPRRFDSNAPGVGRPASFGPAAGDPRIHAVLANGRRSSVVRVRRCVAR